MASNIVFIMGLLSLKYSLSWQIIFLTLLTLFSYSVWTHSIMIPIMNVPFSTNETIDVKSQQASVLIIFLEYKEGLCTKKTQIEIF